MENKLVIEFDVSNSKLIIYNYTYAQNIFNKTLDIVLADDDFFIIPEYNDIYIGTYLSIIIDSLCPANIDFSIINAKNAEDVKKASIFMSSISLV